MKQYVVDAFTDHVFSGNPAAVCIMDGWISDELMLAVAKENNLSETAFAVKEEEGYRLRWFTPGGEIDLCGHATLAAASVIMNHYEPDLLEIRFRTMGGILAVKKTEEKSTEESSTEESSIEEASSEKATTESASSEPSTTIEATSKESISSEETTQTQEQESTTPLQTPEATTLLPSSETSLPEIQLTMEEESPAPGKD